MDEPNERQLGCQGLQSSASPKAALRADAGSRPESAARREAEPCSRLSLPRRGPPPSCGPRTPLAPA